MKIISRFLSLQEVEKLAGSESRLKPDGRSV